jgi:transposase
MTIVMGLDQHRAQITYDLLDTETGEVRGGRIRPADRESVRGFLQQFAGARVQAALEATTGWRFLVEELQAIGAEVHLAEPAETSERRGRKKRAKTDRADARHLRELLSAGQLPESWLPPAHLLELRSRVRLRHTLAEQRTEWQQRMQAQLYHHGVPQRRSLLTAENRTWLEQLELPGAARLQIEVALRMIDQIRREVEPIERELRSFARRQPGCRALMRQYGIGELTAVTILAELGDARRFRNGDAVVRYTGLDVTVYSSDGKRTPGRLSRQGPEVLRWALFEAAKCSARASAPDHGYYQDVRERLTANRATLSVARKLVRRARHILAGLGDAALAPVDVALLPPLVPAVPAAADAA